MRALKITYAGIVIAIAAASMAFGATPATHTDNPDHEWYTQQYNLLHGNCCGLGDAFILEEDEWKNLGNDKYSVKIDGEWHTVEASKRRDVEPSKPGSYGYEPFRGMPAPSKSAVVWYDHKGGGGELRIWCFSPWENLY